MMTDTDRIRDALSFVPANDRDVWVKMGMAIKSELGDAGYDVWKEWSQQDDSFNDRDAMDVWRGIKANGKVTLGTLFHKAKMNGWNDDGVCRKPTRDELAERRRVAVERAAKEEAEMARERVDTAKKAKAILKAATEAKADHPYLSRKQVLPVATLREISDRLVYLYTKHFPRSGGDMLSGRLLVIPVKQGNDISTLELIDESGRKAALAGRGSKTAGYWATERLPDGDGTGLTLLIGEGVATVLSTREATGHPAVAALSSNNLLAVAKTLRERYPAAALVILADLVKTTGEPEHHAVEAARAVGGRMAVPDFGPDRQNEWTDFNDLHQARGREAVKEIIEKALAGAGEPAKGETSAVGESPPASDADGNGWPDPHPLAAKIEPEPYPLDALPDTIRAAVEEVRNFVQAPVPLVASSALAALSLAGQSYADARRAEKLQGPVGLFLLTVADSGERKSTCDGFFTKAIRDHEEAQAETAKPLLKDHRAMLAAWEAKHGGVKEKIRQLAKNGKPTGEAEIALADLEHNKPEPPRTPRLLYVDATPEALAYGLAKHWPSGGVVSAEGGIVFGSHGMGKECVMRNLSLLNQLWDGNPLTIDRRTSESFTVRGARLTVALQVQEPTLREFFTRSGALARGTGFLARFLVSWPESTQGQRAFKEAPANWPALAAFNRRITAILEQPAPLDDDGALIPPAWIFTPEAKAAWIEFHDAIESELSSGGELFDVRDVASKTADNAARLAALFQMFAGAGGAIGLEAFEGASRIVAWHLSESRRFFGELALPVELADAARLDDWLIGYCQWERTHMVGKNHVRQHGPLRDGARLDAAIRELAGLDRLRLEKDGKRLTIQVNPALVIERGAS